MTFKNQVMKIKQELVSMVTITIHRNNEEQFYDWCSENNFRWMHELSISNYDTNNNRHLMYIIKMSEFPKLQRFVRNFNKSS
jgi:hypothetical protein